MQDPQYNKSDIKVMLPRTWEPALLRARAQSKSGASTSTMTGFVTKLVEDHLKNGGFFGEPTGDGSPASEALSASA